jgi:hypothetical protein
MKQIIDLRPVYHRLEERIRAHVILCWLALLLVRIIETTTHATWPTIRRELDRLHLGTFTGPPAGSGRSPPSPSRRPTCSPSSTSPPRSKVIDLQPTPPNGVYRVSLERDTGSVGSRSWGGCRLGPVAAGG